MTESMKIPKQCPECGKKIKLVRQAPIRYTMKKRLLVGLIFVMLILLFLLWFNFHEHVDPKYKEWLDKHLTNDRLAEWLHQDAPEHVFTALYFLVLLASCFIFLLPDARDIKCPGCAWTTTVIVSRRQFIRFCRDCDQQLRNRLLR